MQGVMAEWDRVVLHRLVESETSLRGMVFSCEIVDEQKIGSQWYSLAGYKLNSTEVGIKGKLRWVPWVHKEKKVEWHQHGCAWSICWMVQMIEQEVATESHTVGMQDWYLKAAGVQDADIGCCTTGIQTVVLNQYSTGAESETRCPRSGSRSSNS